MPGPRESFAESEELYGKIVALCGQIYTDDPDVISTDRQGRIDGAWKITISGPWELVEPWKGTTVIPERDILEGLVREYREHPAASTALQQPDDRFPLMTELHIEHE